MNTDEFPFEREAPSLGMDEVNHILEWATERKASDIVFLSGKPAWGRFDGEWRPLTRRKLSGTEVADMLDSLSAQPAASTRVKAGTDVNFAYEHKLDRLKRIRFRGVGTGCRDGWGSGIEIVLRTIASLPPKLDALGVEPELVDALSAKSGVALVVGKVGSGKTTLLAALLRHINESRTDHILSYEHPIEFDQTSNPGAMGPVIQTEIPTHLQSFDLAPPNSMRRAGDVVLFGESRDKETLSGMLIVGESGVMVYSTVHSNSVADTIPRILQVFTWQEQPNILGSLLSTLRVVVYQELLRSPKGGRVPLKEWLIFDDTVRDALRHVDTNHLAPATEELVKSHGRFLLTEAREKFDQGLIFEEDLRRIQDIYERREKAHVA